MSFPITLTQAFAYDQSAALALIAPAFKDAGDEEKQAIVDATIPHLAQVLKEGSYFHEPYHHTIPQVIKVFRDTPNQDVQQQNIEKITTIIPNIIEVSSDRVRNLIKALLNDADDEIKNIAIKHVTRQLADVARPHPNNVHKVLEDMIAHLDGTDLKGSCPRFLEAAVSKNFVRIPTSFFEADWYLPKGEGKAIRIKHAFPAKGGCKTSIIADDGSAIVKVFNGATNPEAAEQTLKSKIPEAIREEKRILVF